MTPTKRKKRKKKKATDLETTKPRAGVMYRKRMRI
jgi:hypothetical protein